MASRTVSQRILLTLGLFALIIVSLIPSPAQAKSQNYDLAPTEFSIFVQSVINGNANELRGVYAPGVMALPIVQQPNGNPGFVSRADETLTQFGMANAFGNIGLLAHNTLAGKYFSSLAPGQLVYLIYGNGEIKTFIVAKALRFQAHEPNNPYSFFTDLDSGLTYSAEEVFRQVYTGDYHVTFQTCIANGDELSWGRLFVIAIPLTQYFTSAQSAQ